MKIDSSLRPFEKKSFFLDLSGFPQETSLIKNLKALGARHEPVFSKYVSFVVSNKVPLNSSSWNQNPYSPLTPKSNGMCPSPQLLSDCSMDYLDSSAYAISPTTDQNPPSPKVQSRGMALLKKATQKVKKNQQATNLLEHCKRWGIKVYHVDKILSKVKKYKNLIAAHYAKQKAKDKKNNKEKQEYPPGVTKLHAPFIKIEDNDRKFRPVFQEFTSWTDVIDSTLSRNINQLNKQFKRTGDLKDVSRSVFAEINLNLQNPFRTQIPYIDDSNTKSYTKFSETLKPSNPTSVQVSTIIHMPLEKEKENATPAKNNQHHRKAKFLYCEICHKNYKNLDEHINTEKHKKFMSNPINFLVVQNVVTSLPKKGDDLLRKPYLNDESNNMSFSGLYFDADKEILASRSILYQPEISPTNYDPAFDFHDYPTEPYSFLDPEVVSPSCSSPDSVPLPFLQDSVEKLPENPYLKKSKTEDNIFDIRKVKNPDFYQEFPMDFRNPALLENACLNIAGNCWSNDMIVDGNPQDLATINVVDTLVEGNECQIEPVHENQIYVNAVSDATGNVFAENYIHAESESPNNVEPISLPSPSLVNLSSCNLNKLPEESSNTVLEKENCDLISVLKDKANDNMEPMPELQPISTETQENVCGKRKKRNRTITGNSDSRSKRKRRKMLSKNPNCGIEKTETEVTVLVESCNISDSIYDKVVTVSSVKRSLMNKVTVPAQSNLLSESLSLDQIDSSLSEGTCDSQDSAIVVAPNGVHLKPVSSMPSNADKISESVSETLNIYSKTSLTLNPNECIGKSCCSKILPSEVKFISEETCDSHDSAIEVSSNSHDSKTLTSLQNGAENILDSTSEVSKICSEAALAFEIVNLKDCEQRRCIETCVSDSSSESIFERELLFQVEIASEEAFDSRDSAVEVPSNDVDSKSITTLQKMPESASETFEICSEAAPAFEIVNPKDCEQRRCIETCVSNSSLESIPERVLLPQVEFASEETCDSRGSAVEVPSNDIDSKSITTLQKIPESASETFRICSEAALAFEIVNPKDCKEWRIIEPCTSDSEDLNCRVRYKLLQTSAVDSGIDILPPLPLHSALNSSFEKSAVKETLDKYLDQNCLKTVSSVNSCNSDDCPESNFDSTVLQYSDEKERESSINLDTSDSLDTSASSYPFGIDYPLEPKDTLHLEDSMYHCPADVDSSVGWIHEDDLMIEAPLAHIPELEKSAAISAEQNEKTVLEAVNACNDSDGIFENYLSLMPVVSPKNCRSYKNNSRPRCDLVSENKGYDSINFEIQHQEAEKINITKCSRVSTGNQSLFLQKAPDLEVKANNSFGKKNKPTKFTLTQYTFVHTFLSESRYLSCIYGKLQLLYVNGLAMKECLFICSLTRCLSGFKEISVAETPKFQECIISVNSTIKISPVKQSPAYHSLDMLKESYSSKEKWNLLLVKMEDLKLESGFIDLILANCCGKALITLSGIRNKSAVNKNVATQPKPSSPVFVTILLPHQDTSVPNYGNEKVNNTSFSSALLHSSSFVCDIGDRNLISSNHGMIESSSNNSSAIYEQLLLSNLPLNLSTKVSEQIDMNVHQASTEIPRFSPYLTDAVDNSGPHSSLHSPSDYCPTYEEIAEKLNQASSNFQYIEPISVCSSDCEINCCKPCTCDLGGGKCLPQLYNNFQYVETNSTDSSNYEWDLPCVQATPNNLSKFSDNPAPDFKEKTPKMDKYEVYDDDKYKGYPSSPMYVVIDDADVDSDSDGDEWHSIRSQVDDICRQYCNTERF